MLKSRANVDGHETLFIGISEEEMRCLKADKGLHIEGETCGLNADIVIFYAPDTDAPVDAT